ncbi:FKBP-type peptidyl-prolyl cis-trans isomerase [Enteractinococcus fodinae]|uniref:Peptidyl-prolyl cis-trans isomerase n=1 Tax=Enteractinococcus fodinae TaxID=684663 RepID=A0ABU2B0N6_9MICC|nr:FKBP-type peptidyl-prolyl cis-trans isomerase [Enteractinococcus fodinae]MDR7347165.1 peptidylprolyl isomerase [Enteractinococcus fodinae]
MSTQHSRSKIVTLTGVLLSAALGLTACGGDDENDAQANAEAPDVEITYVISEDTEEVEINGELTMDEPAAWLISEGDGEPLEEGDLLHILSADIDIQNEEVNAHDFDLGGQTLQLSEQFESQNPQAYEALVGAPTGSDLAYYLPADTLGQDTPAYLNIIAIEDTVPTHATGEPVAAAELNDALPEVTLDEETQAPIIAEPEGEAPEELVVDVLKAGDGPEVQSGSYVTIQYRGIKWSDGEEFDSSWGPDNTGGPAQFELQQLITGWQEGLEGQQVGSQVIMSIPPELAYGGDEHELQEETLVFVIDILHSADPITAE